MHRYIFRILLMYGVTTLALREAWAEEYHDDILASLFSAWKTSQRSVSCARGLFKYECNEYEYDLEAEYARALADDGRVHNSIENAKKAARILAGIRGIPARQQASSRSVVVEMAFAQSSEPQGAREMWTQVRATYSVEAVDSASAGWLLERWHVPQRISLWKAGLSYFFDSEINPSSWDQFADPSGVFLVPPFDLFGCNNNYITSDMVHTDGVWDVVIEPEPDAYKIVWTNRKDPRSQRGVEVLIDDPNAIRKSWSIFDGIVARESLFEEFISVSSTKHFPRISRFRVYAPVDGRTLLAREEVYELIGTNIVLSCEFNMNVFDPAYLSTLILRGSGVSH